MRCPKCGKRIGFITYLLHWKRIECSKCHSLLRHQPRGFPNVIDLILGFISMYGIVIINKRYQWVIKKVKYLTLYCIKILEKYPMILIIIWVIFIYYLVYYNTNDFMDLEEKITEKDDKTSNLKKELK